MASLFRALRRAFNRRDFVRLVAAAGAGLSFPGVAFGQPSRPSAGEAERSINVFSKHLQWLDYREMAETAAEIGFDGVDLTVRDGGHVLPENVERDLPRAVEAVRNVGLDVPMITTGITDPDDPLTERVLQTASSLGIRHYRMGYLRYDEDRNIPETLAAYKSQLRDLAALNERYDISAGYQNHAGTQVGGPVWDLWPLVEDRDPRWLGIQYDIRHATVEGGTAWPLGLQLLQSHVTTMVIKDFRWTRNGDAWEIENVPLGEGMVDFARYFALVEQYDIAGPISVHYEYPLGGAEHGERQLTIAEKQVTAALERDLKTLKAWLEGT